MAAQSWRGMPAALLRGNAVALPLADGCVDLVVTSPPYFSLRSYQDNGEHFDGQIGSEETPQEFLEALWAVTAECARVLKPTGSMFVNLGDKYAGSGGHNNSGISRHGTGKSTLSNNGKPDVARRAVLAAKLREQTAGGGGADRRAEQREASRRNAPDAYNKATIGGARAKSLMGLPWRYAIGCIDQLNLILRAEIVWAKPNGLPESADDRVQRRHEQWFHLTREPTYFAAMDELRVPSEIVFTAPQNGTKHHERAMDASEGHHRFDVRTNNPLGKLPGSVWTVPSEPLKVPEALEVDHFAAFPQEWPRRLITGWCPPGGVVLDPFGGTGTTTMVARALGRFGVHVDLSNDYLRLARWRIFDSLHGAKSAARSTREAQMELS